MMDEIERLQEREKELLAQLKKKRSQIRKLRIEFTRFLNVCSEGCERGRAIDIIPAREWARAHAAIEAK